MIGLFTNCLVRLGLHSSQSVYQDDHWTYSQKLEKNDFAEIVQSEINAGRTIFVRFIASTKWSWWRKQAPAWNRATKAFAGNKDVSFGDVNVKEDKIDGPHNPGRVGWPTIRYFNAETGINGGDYKRKTTSKLDEELGSDEGMRAYILDYGKTSLNSLDGDEMEV